MKELLKSHQFDGVVDFQGFEAEHIEADLELFHNKTFQYVMISTASAYQKPPVDYLIKESTPLNNPYWPYSRKKIACKLRKMQAYREHPHGVSYETDALIRPHHHGL